MFMSLALTLITWLKIVFEFDVHFKIIITENHSIHFERSSNDVDSLVQQIIL